MESALTLSEAFELYRKDVIVYKNQSAKTEEMNRCAMKSIVDFLGDISIERFIVVVFFSQRSEPILVIFDLVFRYVCPPYFTNGDVSLLYGQ